jgi:GTP cyclohydrolase IA
MINGKHLTPLHPNWDNDSDHSFFSAETPLRPDAFDISDEDKIDKIRFHVEQILNTLGMDLEDDSLKGTPLRVAKMYVEEVFSGLNPLNKPAISLFDNNYAYREPLVERNITFYTHCEHHLVPFFGRAHVAYVPSGKVIGLSKLNRLVNYFARRPQVQERLTMQIGQELQKILNTPDVAIMIEAKHLCVASRGIQDDASQTITTFMEGVFAEQHMRSEFMRSIKG